MQTGLLTGVSFERFVYHYGDTKTLTREYIGWFTLPVICGVVSMVVQFFFAWRIYLLSRLRLLAGGIVAVGISAVWPSLATLTAVFFLALVASGFLRHCDRGDGELRFPIS